MTDTDCPVPKAQLMAADPVFQFIARWRAETEALMDLHPDNADLKLTLARIIELQRELDGGC